MKPMIVGISGPKENGKSTLAKKIASIMTNALIYEMPEPMIEIAKIITIDNDFQKGKTYELIPGNPLTGTQILQKIGSESFRHVFGDEIWTHRMSRLFDGPLKLYNIILIPNIRMPVELSMIDFHIWLECQSVQTTQFTAHETEYHLDKMKEAADVRIVRSGMTYNMPTEELIDNIIYKLAAFRSFSQIDE